MLGAMLDTVWTAQHRGGWSQSLASIVNDTFPPVRKLSRQGKCRTLLGSRIAQLLLQRTARVSPAHACFFLRQKAYIVLCSHNLCIFQLQTP